MFSLSPIKLTLTGHLKGTKEETETNSYYLALQTINTPLNVWICVCVKLKLLKCDINLLTVSHIRK